jgi:hypothetical protein
MRAFPKVLPAGRRHPVRAPGCVPDAVRHRRWSPRTVDTRLPAAIWGTHGARRTSGTLTRWSSQCPGALRRCTGRDASHLPGEVDERAVGPRDQPNGRPCARSGPRRPGARSRRWCRGANSPRRWRRWSSWRRRWTQTRTRLGGGCWCPLHLPTHFLASERLECQPSPVDLRVRHGMCTIVPGQDYFAVPTGRYGVTPAWRIERPLCFDAQSGPARILHRGDCASCRDSAANATPEKARSTLLRPDAAACQICRPDREESIQPSSINSIGDQIPNTALRPGLPVPVQFAIRAGATTHVRSSTHSMRPFCRSERSQRSSRRSTI